MRKSGIFKLSASSNTKTVFTAVSSIIGKEKALASLFIRTAEPTKENGARTKGAAADSRFFRMAIHIMELMRREKRTGKAFISGRMERSTMVSGCKE